MMKFVFAFVVLLHLSYGYRFNITLNGEIIERLKTLNHLNRVRNITCPDTMLVPKPYMYNNPRSCVNIFVKELKQVLDNVTVGEASRHILLELQANLQVLDPPPHPQIDHECKMEKGRKTMLPFRPYIKFIEKLSISTEK